MVKIRGRRYLINTGGLKLKNMKTLNFENTHESIEALEALGVEITFDPQEEDIAPDFDDEETIKEIERQYNNGNFFAWFCAHIIVKYRGYEAHDYLGCCSYKSAKDFKENSGYYFDMISTCINEINKEIESNNASICKGFQVRNLKRTAEALGYLVIPKSAVL